MDDGNDASKPKRVVVSTFSRKSYWQPRGFSRQCKGSTAILAVGSPGILPGVCETVIGRRDADRPHRQDACATASPKTMEPVASRVPASLLFNFLTLLTF